MNNHIDKVVNEMNEKVDRIFVNVRNIIKQRDDALNLVKELREEVDRLESERGDLLDKIYSLRDEINNKERYGNYRNI